MSYVFELSKILKIDKNAFLESLKTCEGLPHRYEIFYKKIIVLLLMILKQHHFKRQNFALKNSKNIYWIVGGLPKKNDKLILSNLKKNIVKAYIIGKNISFFNNQLKKSNQML